MMTTQAIADIYPLVPLQQGILFHSLLAPQSGAYVVQVNFRIEGNFNSSAFEQAWQQVIARHTVLRTAFVWESLEKPLQVVGQQVKLPISILDWQQFTADEQQQQLKDLLQTQRTQSFVLTQAPLMRLTLVQMQPQQWQIIWCYHHLLLDGWSVPLLLQEVLTYYHSFSNGQPVTLPTPRPYRDYIAWLQQQSLAEAEQFWRKTLSGFCAPTPLKSIQEASQQLRSPHAAASTQYREHQLHLLPELATQLQAFAQQHQLTLNTLFQAAYALLLSCYNDELDVVFGVTSSGRPPELNNSNSMIGLFINTLPLRVKVHSQKQLLPWLRDLQSTQIDLRQYEFTSLIDIHRWSEIPRSSPLFESLLIFENYPISPDMKRSLTQLNLHNIQTTEQTNYPLTLYVVADENVTMRVLYDSDRFTSSSMIRMLKHLQILLAGIIKNSDQRVSELTLLTPAEQQQLLVAWNATDDHSIPSLCFHQRFEHQARHTPDAIAVTFQDSHLTYAHLNDRANQLAHYLISLDLAPEAPIALHLDRSLEMIVALLAILKAGGCYLPLDPSLPTERLAFMLSDAQAKFLITTRDLPPIPAVSVRSISIDNGISEPIHNPARPTTSAHAAYLLYTSGSTGTPKAVQILHSALTNFLHAMQQRLSLSPEDRLLAVTTLSFDIAALELFLPLTLGASVVIASRETALDSSQLSQAIAQQQISVMQATPATWRMLLIAGWQGRSNLTMLCGGEALDGKLANQLLIQGKALWNLYGPTETTIWSVMHQVTDAEAGTLVPIGGAIANTSCYVLDRHLQPVPVGVAGELWIGGAGLARGYLKRPELTAEKFMPNPFGVGRIYRTGDRVRYGADGSLEYLERIDHQVKLRGYRIELGEIEATLMQHPEIETAIVLLRQDQPDDRQIVAYLRSSSSIPIPDLRAYLQNQLPYYMIPTFYVTLEQFPLTPNGKLDRRALPPPERDRPTQTAYVPPKTEAETAIATIWQQILNIEQVGIHDNFFDLGGHSLLLIKAHTQIRIQFTSDLLLVDLFRYPTVSSLAAHLTRAAPSLLIETRQTQLEAGKARLKHRLNQKRDRPTIS